MLHIPFPYLLCVFMLSHFSCVRLFVTLWTMALQAPLSMGFSRQEYRSGLPRPPPGDLSNPGIKPTSLTSPTLAGWFSTTSLGFPSLGFPCGLSDKESTCNARDLGSVPGLGRSPGEGNGYPLQYSCLENAMDRGAWWATV